MPMKPEDLEKAQQMAADVTNALGGAGIWGVEFFITADGPVFSELSPRPHDTGMVTLAGTQNFNEFELHVRAVLGIPIPAVNLERNGASAVILAHSESNEKPTFSGLEKAALHLNSDFKLFGKPTTRPYRRMAVALTYGNESVADLVEKAKRVASEISVS
jgi:phosphoribosylglycinamide formyltransferase 2